ncbi:uncharacterized protein BP01DRAFT_363070 [Aspergillus saccharolyticus JOP 1030-1]|uniref:Uncharacterized protein n=1 Tax=Aspergillus saccharolyticus JOP 1030-1 TaxID=1450539 RepID=A0A319AQB8_9EURO|nr:hypothetical protein BP01DRAFT_363070 [Aspergillus saccharolyticus JOP 1030-1]PYH48602.1 hypothetical protein BP01DRAFT_363070 [Aspergillus saccharolyticus JOP 1030-1]
MDRERTYADGSYCGVSRLRQELLHYRSRGRCRINGSFLAPTLSSIGGRGTYRRRRRAPALGLPKWRSGPRNRRFEWDGNQFVQSQFSEWARKYCPRGAATLSDLSGLGLLRSDVQEVYDSTATCISDQIMRQVRCAKLFDALPANRPSEITLLVLQHS